MRIEVLRSQSRARSRLFVGHGGHMIEAVQHLAQRIVFREGRSPARVVVDADGYRQRRAESLQAEANGGR